MDNPVVSVVMAAYNSEASIKQSIDSVIAQTYNSWELIIVVDPSSDSTADIVRGYSDKRIRLIENKERLGISHSRNLGVKEAKGDWIAFIDSDDVWLSEKIEKQIDASIKSDLIFTGSGFMNNNGHIIDYIFHVPAQVTYRELLKQNIISCSSVLIKKEWISKYPMPSAKNITEDYASWLLVLRNIPFAVGIDEPLLLYRLANGSDSSNKIKMIIKNWNTFRYLRVPLPQSVSSLMSYAVRSLHKYRQLKGARK